MLKRKIGEHIAEIQEKQNISNDELASIIKRGVRRVQQKKKTNEWTIEDVEAIEKELGEKILYSAKDFFVEDELKAVIQIELKNKQKELILKQLIGKEDLDLLK